MLIERCLNALYRSKLYDIYLGRRLPPPVTSPAFDHTLSAQTLWYAEGINPGHSHLEAARSGHFRTLPILTSDMSEANRTLAAWFTSHDRFDTETWRADIASERVTRWINAYPSIGPNMSIQMSALWRMQINRHLRHLNRTRKAAITGWRRFLYHQMRVATALVVGDAKPDLQERLNALGEDVDDQIWPDGGHRSRSPSITLAVLALLIEIRDALISKEIEPPGGLVTAIDRMVPWIKGMRHGDGGFALMGGATSNTGPLIEAVLSASNSRARAMSEAPQSGFYRMRAGQTTLLFDCGRPDQIQIGNHAPGSFELSVGKSRIFSNCGAYLGQDKTAAAWDELLRATAASSALVIDDQSVKSVNSTNIDRRDHDGARLIEYNHDGYVPTFGINHRRMIYLDAAGTDIRGEDRLADGTSKPFSIRFHLHPGVNASMVEGGGEVIIKPSKGRGWRFQSDHPVMLDDSVNFFDGRQHRTQQIVVLGNHEPSQSTVKWRLFSG